MHLKLYMVLFVTALACLVTSNANAQTDIRDLKNSTPAQRAQFQTGMMKSKLNLDAGQVTKVQDINLKYARRFQLLLESGDNPLSKLNQGIALQGEKDNELKTVFTKDQFTQYKEFEQALKSKLMARVNGSN